ncbi:MAG: alpha/beta hydrolase [Candidatus Sericytochromatia bacterium]|nr:alpha/beta hydrolase [Candidatus Sericytochromatia bacterium]
MHNYEQSLYQFKALRDKQIHNHVLETDLSFLFEDKKNKIGILLLHGSEATPCNTINLGKMLFEKGYTSLGCLLTGHGVNPDNLHSGNVSWHDCYNSAKESLYILSGLVDKIYILGSSFGGALAYLLGIEFAKQISGVIAVSAPTHSNFTPPHNYHWMKQVHGSIKAVEHNVHNLDVPTLILHGVDDKVVKVEQAFYAYNQIKNEQKKLLIYNKIGHSIGFGFNTEEVVNDIDNFIKSYKKPVSVRFELQNTNADSVSVAGEFNNWNSQANYLYHIDGKWLVDIALAPGQYQYKFVINNIHWILDPNREKSFAPKGEMNSLIVV